MAGSEVVRVLLVHSPLVGPSTWAPVASELRAAGHEVALPDLRTSATSGQPGVVVDAATTAVPRGWDAATLVAHSGAGALLPLIADRLGTVARRMVFVDAGIPPCRGEHTASADFLSRLRELSVDGVLPEWSTWWGSDVMEILVPDGDRRAHIEAEMPRIPLAFYETEFVVPERWCESITGAFLLLSDGYRDDASTARTLGWPVSERAGLHLDIVNEPAAIASTIVELAGD